jgi:hypothetical protein
MNKIFTAQNLRLVAIALATLAMFRIIFTHIVDVATLYGNAATAVWFPIGIDGSIVATALTLSARRGVNRATKNWAMFVRYLAFFFTIFANVSHSGYGSFDAIAINIAPALLLIGLMETLIHASQSTPAARATKRTPKGKHAGNVVPIRKVAP